MTAEVFRTTRRIRFADCDPAGEVHYPKLVALVERVYEAWAEEGWGLDFAELIVGRGIGTPTVEMKVECEGVCRFGDSLDLEIRVLRLGRSSGLVEVLGSVAGARRLRVELAIVTVSTAVNRSVPMPDDVRAALSRYLVPAAA